MVGIKYENVCKNYKKKIVLENLNMEIPTNSIFFLLGLNGAGKTTLLKITNGLLSYSGNVLFSNNITPSVGAIIETPTFYDNLSAYYNLKYYALATGKSEKNIVSVMNQVGLDINNKKKVKQYSLGMRQRLGIARAILNDPDILILDEPLNGLDPAGINEIKELIKRLNNDGMTIIISSHLRVSYIITSILLILYCIYIFISSGDVPTIPFIIVCIQTSAYAISKPIILNKTKK